MMVKKVLPCRSEQASLLAETEGNFSLFRSMIPFHVMSFSILLSPRCSVLKKYYPRISWPDLFVTCILSEVKNGVPLHLLRS